MLLADLGADVVSVYRPGASTDPITSMELPLYRGRTAIELDLHDLDAQDRVLRLVAGADALIEGFRPGVMERLGLGPEACLHSNPRLVYARMTGWGQDGPLAATAGHDLNFLALSGLLYAIGPADQPPVVPLNLVGDFGAGGMLLAVGVLAALLEVRHSGTGQVVDAAIIDGLGSISTMFLGYLANGLWSLDRFANRLDGANPCYTVYPTADGRFVAVAALELKLWRELVGRLADSGFVDPGDRHDSAGWPELRRRLTACFVTRTRNEWSELFSDTDACVTPVLDLAEAADHPQVVARGSLRHTTGGLTSGVVPRFSRTPGAASDTVRATSLADVENRWAAPGQ